MRAWAQRNIGPIALTLVAAALVIAAVELLDAVVGSTPSSTTDAAAEAAVEGAAAFAGLIKVSLFLAVGAGLTVLVRRRLATHPAEDVD